VGIFWLPREPSCSCTYQSVSDEALSP
jgi:hypothetical protein